MPDAERVSFFGSKIPALDVSSWKDLRVAGDRWALVGDAAGFADPITGEGIYYAFKSSDLLADALISVARGAGTEGAGATRYDGLWRCAFGHDLERASYRLSHFYHGRFLGHGFTDAMILLARHHRGVRTILARALTGEQSYRSLRRDALIRLVQVF